ncbi:MAG: sulfur carrier protein ThiS [Thermoplasmatota archaeon]
MELPDGATVADLMAATGESIDVTLCLRGNIPVAEDTLLVDNESVTLLSAASGG